MSALYYTALAMLGGLLMTRLTRLAKLPNVTAYLIAGVLIGPYVFNLVGSDMLEGFGVITECALGFIAFSIGDEFKLESLKAIGKPAILITLFESVFAVICTMSFTLLLGFNPIICIMLGALSASTAPAATLLIVRQYKASGPLTDMLLPVVAADDATGLIAYSICVSIAQNMVNHTAFSFAGTVLLPLLHIAEALLLGAVLGHLGLHVHHLGKVDHVGVGRPPVGRGGDEELPAGLVDVHLRGRAHRRGGVHLGQRPQVLGPVRQVPPDLLHGGFPPVGHPRRQVPCAVLAQVAVRQLPIPQQPDLAAADVTNLLVEKTHDYPSCLRA